MTEARQQLLHDVAAILRSIEGRVRDYKEAGGDVEATLEIADTMEKVGEAYWDMALNLRAIVNDLDDDDE